VNTKFNTPEEEKSRVYLKDLIKMDDFSGGDALTFEFLASHQQVEEKVVAVPLQYQYLEKIFSGEKPCISQDNLIITGEEGIKKLSECSAHRIYKFFKEMAEKNVFCMVVCNNAEVGDRILDRANRFGVPVLRTPMNPKRLISVFLDRIHTLTTNVISFHGNMLDVFGVGVLMCGESGVGKSETSLELISRGHRLVCDDLVKLYKNRMGRLTATYFFPESFGLMEVRGVGIINIENIFGASALRPVKEVDILIKLISWREEKEIKKNGKYKRIGEEDLDFFEDHTGRKRSGEKHRIQAFKEILNTRVYYKEVPVGPGRNIATIVEVIVKNYLHHINRR